MGRNIGPLLIVGPHLFRSPRYVLAQGDLPWQANRPNSKLFICQRTGQIALFTAFQLEQTDAFDPSVYEDHPSLSSSHRWDHSLRIAQCQMNRVIAVTSWRKCSCGKGKICATYQIQASAYVWVYCIFFHIQVPTVDIPRSFFHLVFFIVTVHYRILDWLTVCAKRIWRIVISRCPAILRIEIWISVS